MDSVLLAKYLANECSADERELVLAWIAASEQNAAVFAKCLESWEQAALINPDENVETDLAWNKLRLRIESAPVTAPLTISKKKKLTLRLLRAAAVLIPILMITWYIVNDRFVQLAEFRTKKGERRQITLSDGTQVWLNSESTLKYPTKFDKTGKREVYLNGEAYFKVSADSNHMFVVNTDKVSAKAYGTSFNVSGYPEQEEIVVALDEGKLAVETENNESTMTIRPGQCAKINKDEQKIALDSIAGSHNLWINNKIVFENEELSDVLITLERWYNTKITLENKNLANCRFSGSFTDKKLEEILDVLKEALNISVEKKQDTFYISGEGC